MANIGKQYQVGHGPSVRAWLTGFLGPLRSKPSMMKRAQEGVRLSYEERVKFLKDEAKSEGIHPSEASEREFWSFIGSPPTTKRGDLFLTDDGNLNAMWNGDGDNRVALEFPGGRVIRYALLQSRQNGKVSRVCGDDSQDAVRQKIRELELESLLST